MKRCGPVERDSRYQLVSEEEFDAVIEAVHRNAPDWPWAEWVQEQGVGE